MLSTTNDAPREGHALVKLFVVLERPVAFNIVSVVLSLGSI